MNKVVFEKHKARHGKAHCYQHKGNAAVWNTIKNEDI